MGPKRMVVQVPKEKKTAAKRSPVSVSSEEIEWKEESPTPVTTRIKQEVAQSTSHKSPAKRPRPIAQPESDEEKSLVTPKKHKNLTTVPSVADSINKSYRLVKTDGPSSVKKTPARPDQQAIFRCLDGRLLMINRSSSLKGKQPAKQTKQQWPNICEVMQAVDDLDDRAGFYDELLAASYRGLPKLRLGGVVPSSDLVGTGQYLISRLTDEKHMADLDESLAVAALTFVRSGLYVNPSRYDPALVTCRPGDYNSVTLHNSNDNIIFLSTVITNESHLTKPKKIGGAVLKFMTGIFHALEWERFCSFFCMVFGTDQLVAQMAYDAINFQTKYESVTDSGDGPSSPEVSPRKSSDIFNKVRSPVIRGSTSAGGRTLLCSEKVPVYDARNTDFDLPTDLSRLTDVLPEIDSELPYRSLVTVLYTANTYRKRNPTDKQFLPERQLSLNIQAVILLGTMNVSMIG